MFALHKDGTQLYSQMYSTVSFQLSGIYDTFRYLLKESNLVHELKALH